MLFKQKILLSSLALLTSVMLGARMDASAEQTSSQVQVYFVPMNFLFDDKQLAPSEDQRGFIYEGSSYVPLRFITYALNKGIQWNGDTYTVSISDPTEKDKTEINEYKVNHQVRDGKIEQVDTSHLTSQEINVYTEKVTYLFDNVVKQPSADLPGVIYNDSLYVPMRFFSEAVGKKIEWDPKTYTITAKTEPSKSDETNKPDPSPAESPSPSTAPNSIPSPFVGGGGGGGGGAVTTNASYDSIKSEADARITVLQNKAITTFAGILQQYRQDPSLKETLKAQGEAALVGFDAEFEGIMSWLQSQLSSTDTTLIDSYRTQYKSAKDFARATLGK